MGKLAYVAPTLTLLSMVSNNAQAQVWQSTLLTQ
jgi:hypothetical protein